jgi:hypothetical protein
MVAREGRQQGVKREERGGRRELIKLKLPTLVTNSRTDQDVGTNYLRSVPDSAQANRDDS